jgi:protein-tyrosine phosphatase
MLKGALAVRMGRRQQVLCSHIERERVKKVLFVCTANICRSPMAHTIFDALAEDEGLPFRAESAGTAALEGRPIAPNAVAALEEVGIYPRPHSARRVNEAMVEEAELVLAMTPQHAAALRRLGNNPAGGIYALPEYTMGVQGEGIPDPYGLTMAAYRSTLRQLYGHVERVVRRLGGLQG